MAKVVVIYVNCHDDDVDWLRNKCVPAVENAVEEAADEGRLDGEASVSWTIDGE